MIASFSEYMVYIVSGGVFLFVMQWLDDKGWL